MAGSDRDKAPEVAEVPGLEELVKLDALVGALAALRDQMKADLRPTLASFYVEEARQTDDYPKTFTAVEGTASATVTLKKKTVPKAGLPRDAVARLGALKVPLRQKGGSLVVNGEYVENLTVLTALARLLAANPEAGIPVDFIEKAPVVTVPDDKDNRAALKILRLPSAADAVTALPLVCDIQISKAVLAGEDTLRDFARRAEEMLGSALAAANRAMAEASK